MEFLELAYQKFLELFDVFQWDIIVFYFATSASVLLFEYLVLGWERSSVKRIIDFKGSVKNDVIYFLLGAFNIYNLIVVLMSFGIINVLARLFYEATNYDLILHIQNPFLQFSILFLVSDLKKYVSHFVFHKFGFLWKLHEMHHSADEFCVLTRYRGHFFETALKKFFDVIPFAILGAPVETYILVGLFAEVHQMLIHSGFKSNWGFIGKYILVSPANHRLHHSIKREDYGKNFGGTFIFWDHMFGTYAEVDRDIVIGTVEEEYNKKGFIHDNILGMKNFFREIVRSKSKD